MLISPLRIGKSQPSGGSVAKTDYFQQDDALKLSVKITFYRPRDFRNKKKHTVISPSLIVISLRSHKHEAFKC